MEREKKKKSISKIGFPIDKLHLTIPYLKDRMTSSNISTPNFITLTNYSKHI